MESLLKSPMKLMLLTAWLSTLMDPCSLSDICDSCHQHATCKPLNGSNACFCNQGYTGDGTTFCNDDDECQNVTGICGEGGTCTNTMGSYYCTCVSGFMSTGNIKFQPNDGTNCAGIDECRPGRLCGTNSLCHITNGSFYCTCQRDYIPSPTSGNTFGNCCFSEDPQKFCHDNSGCITQAVNKTLEYISNFTDPQSLLEEIGKQTSGELTSVEVIAYVEALCRSASTLAAGEKDYALNPSVINSTLSVIFVYFVYILCHPFTDLTETFIKNTITFDSLLSLLNSLCSSGSVSVVFVRYDRIGEILKPSSDPGLTDYSRYAGTGEIIVNSPVIAVAIKPANVYQLDHVTFTLRHTEPVDTKADVTKCAFWEYTLDSLQGHWATHGCKTVHVSSNATTCSCNHLTHFALLMSSGRANLVAHYTILTRITQLGMIISLICLSMCIFTFWFFSEIQSTRTTIHKNLCCSLFMAEFIFLVGINMNSHKLFCSVIAGLLHYFFLAAFAWMCIEGIHLYLIVVGVIYNKGFLHRNFYIFGYGSPAVVVAISATLGSKYYGTDRVCWLSTENHFIWSFIGPACLIILVNLLAFVVIIYKVYRHTAVKKPEISHYENIRSCARGALALLFVLGATWTFGVLHILHETTLTAYLFTITNTFQGMFIFIFLCVLSRKIQEEYYRLFKNVPCCFECLR
uniref:Adhesion G protein-coupled receptor L4 n=1 Tax=Monopterus albus TaxID=43700 RepID=A0A3Q3JSE3_MONAL